MSRRGKPFHAPKLHRTLSQALPKFLPKSNPIVKQEVKDDVKPDVKNESNHKYVFHGMYGGQAAVLSCNDSSVLSIVPSLRSLENITANAEGLKFLDSQDIKAAGSLQPDYAKSVNPGLTGVLAKPLPPVDELKRSPSVLISKEKQDDMNKARIRDLEAVNEFMDASQKMISKLDKLKSSVDLDNAYRFIWNMVFPPHIRLMVVKEFIDIERKKEEALPSEPIDVDDEDDLDVVRVKEEVVQK